MAAIQFLDATDTYRARRVEKLNRSDRESEMKIKTAELEHSYRGPLEIVAWTRRSKRMRPSEKEALFKKCWKKV